MRKYLLGIYRLILLLFIASSLFSCAAKGLPSPKNEESTVLVINVNIEKMTGRIAFKYRFTFDDGSFITFYPNHGNKYISHLSPGNYKIVRFQAEYLDSNKKGTPHNVNVSFALEPGKITIFRAVLHLSVEKVDKYNYLQTSSFKNMSNRTREEIISQLSENETFNQWEIKEKSGKTAIKSQVPGIHPYILKWDKNGDGKVSRDEFSGRGNFDRLDQNGDGFIDESESPAGVAKGGKKGGKGGKK